MTPASDLIGVGAYGIDLNGDNDNDIERANVTGRLLVDGQGDDDSITGMMGGWSPSGAPLELRGGSGDDVLRGGLSNDLLKGGTGFDSISDSRSGGFTLSQTILTGHGTDTLDSIEAATLTGDIGPDTIDASAFNGSVLLDGLHGNDTLRGGAGHDDLRGYVDDDIVDGGPGTDTLHEIVAGDATLTDSTMSGAGSDSLASIERATLNGSSADQTFDASGFSGNVTIVAAGGLDTLLGGPGHDSLHGGDGADELRGGLGYDVFHAGEGDDRTFSDDGVSEDIYCGAGEDVATADALDGVAACEQIDRGGAPSQPDPVDEDPGDSSQPTPASPATPATPAVVADAPATAVMTLHGATVNVSRKGRGRVRVRCAGAACAGELVLKVRRRTIARTPYAVAPDSAAVVRFRLTRKGRALLRRTGRMKVTAAAGNATHRYTLVRRYRS